MSESERVARAYYLIAGIYTLSASLIWGINTLFLLHAGLSLFQVFVANAVFTGSMALFEVPTGVIADIKGRRLSFLLSVAVLFIGTVFYAAIPRFGGGLAWFSAASIVLGLGYTFYSGAVEAWVVDALRAAGSTIPVDRVLARGAAVSGVAMLVGSIAGGVLGTLDLALPYAVRCVLLAGAFALALPMMHETGFVPRALAMQAVPREMARVARESVRSGWNMPRVRLVILGGAAQAVFLEWGFHAWQPYFLELLNSNAAWITGTVAALVSVATVLGNWFTERATRYCGKRTTLLIWAAVIYSGTTIGVGLVSSFTAALVLYLIGMVSVGVSGPVRQGYLHLVVPTEQRATVLSFSSLVSSSGSMGGQLGLGALASRSGLASGYVAGGILAALAIPATLLLRRMGGSPDRIEGDAGTYGVCAPLRLPEGVGAGAKRGAPAQPTIPG